jgi:RNase P/RNase MRP subunit p30
MRIFFTYTQFVNKKNIHFLLDAASRRQLISNAQNLVRVTRGKNIIITSEAQKAMELRGPYDIVNL